MLGADATAVTGGALSASLAQLLISPLSSSGPLLKYRSTTTIRELSRSSVSASAALVRARGFVGSLLGLYQFGNLTCGRTRELAHKVNNRHDWPSMRVIRASA